MKKFYFFLLFSLTLTGIHTVDAQIQCTIARPGVECLETNGTIRPGTPLGGHDDTVDLGGDEDNGGNGGNDDVVGEKPTYCSSIDRAELDSSIVPCGRKVHICYDEVNANCEFKHLFVLVNNLARSFIFVVFAPLLTITLMYIGFLFIKEQAAAKAKAKALLWRVLVGTFFVLGSWLIVNFVLDALDASDEVKSGVKDSSNS